MSTLIYLYYIVYIFLLLLCFLLGRKHGEEHLKSRTIPNYQDLAKAPNLNAATTHWGRDAISPLFVLNWQLLKLWGQKGRVSSFILLSALCQNTKSKFRGGKKKQEMHHGPSQTQKYIKKTLLSIKNEAASHGHKGVCVCV